MKARRVLVLTGVMAAIVIAGIVLFFVFRDVAEPLLSSATSTTAIS